MKKRGHLDALVPGVRLAQDRGGWDIRGRMMQETMVEN